MRILIAGGRKTHNIVEAVKKKFSASGDDIIEVQYIEDIIGIFSTGEYFDKALITEQSITKDKEITDEFELRERVNNFATQMASRNTRYNYVFLASEENMARLIDEEILDIVDDSAVILSRPPYKTTFFIELIVKEAGEIPSEWKYVHEELEAKVDDKIEIDSHIEELDDFNVDIKNGYKELNVKDDFDSDWGDTEDNEFEDDDNDWGEFNQTPENNLDEDSDWDIPGLDDENDSLDEEDFSVGNELEDSDFKDDELEESDFDDTDFEDTGIFNEDKELEDEYDIQENNDIDFNEESVFEEESFDDKEIEDEESFDMSENSSDTEIDNFEDNRFDITESNEDGTDTDSISIEDIDNLSDNEHVKDINGLEELDEYTDDRIEGFDDDYDETEYSVSDEDYDNVDKEGYKEDFDSSVYADNEYEEDSEEYSEEDFDEQFEEDVYTETDDTLEEDTDIIDDDVYDSENPVGIDGDIKTGGGQQPEVEVKKKKGLFGGIKKDKEVKPVKEVKKSSKVGKVNIKKIQEGLKPFAIRGNSIVVTGCGGCGVSFTAYSIANVLNQLGYNVLLVDMDTENRTQTYITKTNFDCVGEDDAKLMSAINSSTSLSNHVSIAKEGFHLLTMGMATDTAPVKDLLHKEKLNRFVNVAKSNYNFVIYDMPLDDATNFLADITYTADNLLLVADASNWGLTKMMMKICNISTEDMRDTFFNKAQLLFNRYRNLSTLFGKKVRQDTDIVKILDQRVEEIIGEDPGFYFSNMMLAGVINDDPDIEEGWFGNISFSDITKGQEIYLRLIERVVLQKD